MKSIKNNKITAIIFLSVIAFFSLIIAFGVAMPKSKQAYATASYLTENVVMAGGAEAYLDPDTDNYSGLKFKSEVTTINPDATYGMMIVPYDYFAKAEITTDSDVDFIKTFLDAKSASKIANDPIIQEFIPELNQTSGKYDMELSISHILPNNYDRQFVGMAFEKIGEDYKYAQISEANIRDIVYIASVGLDNDTDAEQEQIDAMKAFVNKGIENVGQSFKYEITADKASALVGEKINLTLTVQGLRLNQSTFEVTKGDASIVPNGNACEVTLNAWGKVEITATTAGGLVTDTITLWATEEGEIALMKGDDILDRIGSSGESTIEYLTSTDLQSENLSGVYTGNAVKLTYNLATNEPTVQNVMSLSQYEALAGQGYSSLYFYYAIKCSTATMREDKDNAWLLSRGDVSYAEATWIKVSISLSEELGNKLQNNPVELFSVYRTSGLDVSIYIGDIGFEKTLQDGELFFIDENVAKKGTISADDGTITSEYLTASQWAQEGVTANGYTGNALKLSSSTVGSRTWKLAHLLSDSIYDKYVEQGYTKLYIWFTASNENGDAQFATDASLLKSAGTFTNKGWNKITITLDSTLRDKLFTTSQVGLFKMYCSAKPASSTTIYIGDIGFEK